MRRLLGNLGSIKEKTAVRFTFGDTVLFEMQLEGSDAERLAHMDPERLREAGQKIFEALMLIVTSK